MSITKLSQIIAASGFALLLCSGINAAPTNITICDNWYNSSSWHGANEDNEVEPPDIIGQQWDMEAFFLDGNYLSMVAGFDFRNGVTDPNDKKTIVMGDIFLDVTGDAGKGGAANKYGYEYVIKIDYTQNNYAVYSTGDVTTYLNSKYTANAPSNPYASLIRQGAEIIAGGKTGYQIHNENVYGLCGVNPASPLSNRYWDNKANKYISYKHYEVDNIDLSFLGTTTFTSHATMSCGNDNLMGRGSTQVPEASSFLMLMSGALLIAGTMYRRKSV